MTSSPAEEIDRQLDALIEIFFEHFDYEKRILKEVNHPEFDHHIETHRKLLAKAVEIKDASIKGEINAPAVLSFFMNGSILGHVLE